MPKRTNKKKCWNKTKNISGKRFELGSIHSKKSDAVKEAKRIKNLPSKAFNARTVSSKKEKCKKGIIRTKHGKHAVYTKLK